MKNIFAKFSILINKNSKRFGRLVAEMLRSERCKGMYCKDTCTVSCRSRQKLSDNILIPKKVFTCKIGVDTADNEPIKVRRLLYSFAS